MQSLENVPLQSGAMEDGRSDLFDRPRRGIEGRNSLALHELLCRAYLVAAVFQLRVFAVRPPGLTDLLQALGIDRQSEQAIPIRKHRRWQLAVDEVVGRQRKVPRENAELQREIKRGRRLPAARYADENELGLGEIARGRAVVVRLREVDRLHAREILHRVRDAVRAACGVRRLRIELRLERSDEHLEQIEE